MSSGQAVAVRSRDEVAEAIRTLTPAQLARLKAVSRYYSSGRPIEPEDLLQMAFASAIDGRQCPAHVDIVRFLAGAMRSIAHGEAEKVEHRLVLVPVPKTGDQQDKDFEFPDTRPNPEEQMISEENAAALRVATLRLFEDDRQARDIAEGTMADMSVEELRELTDLDQTAYDSKRRLIRRRIDKAFPKGWKP